VIVGAGFGGLYALHKMRSMGLRCRVLERAGGVGGTWYWNRYPGARCDVHSIDYSYSFDADLQREWRWKERYAPQAEILAYLDHVADRFDLRRDIQLDTEVTAATWDESTGCWTVSATTDRGQAAQSFTTRFLITAVGCLSEPTVPNIDGIDRFAGRVLHTGTWPHEPVDFTGQRVGVIGTGSSGIQIIPMIAEVADHLYVFQRTPNFSIPARNTALDDQTFEQAVDTYTERREQARASFAGYPEEPPASATFDVDEATRRAEYERRWAEGGTWFLSTYTDLLLDLDANETAASFVRERISEIVDDPETAERLQPTDYPIGAKRICLDTNYFATYNRPNVTLVDLRTTPLHEVESAGVRTTEQIYALDTLVLATGFDAVTGALLKLNITGVDGLRLADAWADGARTYLGIMTHGFPNLFMLTGPQSPSVRANVVMAIEQHVDWVADCLTYLDHHGLSRIEASEAGQNEWVEHANRLADSTLLDHADSWYLGANIPGKPRVVLPYMGGLARYGKKIAAAAADGYRGFELSAE